MGNMTESQMSLATALGSAGWGELPWAASDPILGHLVVDLGSGCRLTAYDVGGVPMVSVDTQESLGYAWASSPAHALRLLAERESRRLEIESAIDGPAQ
jgi:hypothetical protein